MTARFWLPIVFGLGKIAFILILVLVIFVAIANGREETQLDEKLFVPLNSEDHRRIKLLNAGLIPADELRPEEILE